MKIFYYGMVLSALSFYNKIMHKICGYMVRRRCSEGLPISDKRMTFIAKHLEYTSNAWDDIENRYFYLQK